MGVLEVPPPAPPRNDVLEFWLPGPFYNWITYAKKGGKRRRVEHIGRHPTPKGNRKVARIVPGKGFATVVTDPATREAELALIAALAPFAPHEPWIGALRADFTFVFVPPEKPHWRREACLAGAINPTGATLGDRDNLHKMLADALETAGFYENDARIFDGAVTKTYGLEPGYRVRLQKVHEPESAAEWKAWPK